MSRPTDPHWREQARCTETDPEAFFPEPGSQPTTALRICAGCPVRDHCLTDALNRRDISFGVLGGHTPTQRRDLLRRRDGAAGRPGRAA